ncbi:SusC/RagA family TonB-linked outer membrane protein [Bacteroides nordii]|uniref:SusC/RagA family TonB-linked outer membrane protein n=1 Tax=Bacteroides nordii TaxID=291645 RepID=UPI00189F2B57|nr:SusC/RagA family TonB-linked outer membrane protein [Bacteroides nordii]MBD9110975.1 SusC/RagA family TonB-linked outer membrane protein [Bacteroides nordii]MCE8463906.1 SusC/RagA family TonB-linked outer membrane protein [Bacteroides nordii]UYU50652.1 SusC/RagA family TonB-linked outer membrane protein [Bacteroides nordii]
MKQHHTTHLRFFLLCLFSLFLFSDVVAQKPGLVPLDSLITVGYATGSIKNLSGFVEKITELQMNRDQITNPLDAIRGRVPGLTIQRGTNGQAALDAVRLRGTTSLTSGNDPLIIVDGVFGDLNMLTSIYPTDIESFTILKDASETAQYGSRGASGVIEVTTKKGISGKTRVSYNGSFGITSVYKNLSMLSANGFRQVADERGLSILDLGNNTDFQKEIEQTGFQQNHHVAFYGGSDASSYRVSLGYVDRQGVIQNQDMRNFTSNMNMSQNIFGNFIRCELGMFGSVQKNHNLFDYQKTFYSAATFNPTFPNHKNTETGSWDQITSASQITNPLAWMEVKDHDATSHISTHARLTFNLMDDLKLVMFGAYTYNIVENSQYLPTSVWAHGQAYKGTKKMESLLGNLMLSYKKNWRKHFFDVLALAELQKETYTGYYTTVTNFSSDQFGYDNLQAGAIRLWEGTNSYYEEPHLASFMGRFNYTYADRYILTVNARTDASSKFGSNHKWGFFPSVSAAWAVSEEEFMKRIPLVDNLKLRVGYGLAGNQNGIDSYTTLGLVRPNGVVPVGNSAVVTLGEMQNINPDLKWEVKHTFNAGADLGMFGNRLLLSVNYYNSKTTDMLYLYNVSVPPFTYNTLLANIGSMRNSGTEIAIGITPLKTPDMELNINANITFQRNKLLSLSGTYNGENISAPEYKSLASLDGAGFHGGYNHIVYQIVGQPLGVFYLPHSNGLVSDGDGGYTYGIADLNGGGISLEDGEDRYVAGQAVPKTLLGSNISFRYKRFDISVQINGAFGHKVYNGTSLTYMNMNIFPDYNVMEEAPRRNIKDQTATDYWLEKGDYVNFDYLTIGWNVPLAKAQKYIRSLRLAFTVNNLATISGYSGLSPMINSSTVNSTLGVDDKRGYPLARTYTVGLSINF